MKYATLVLALFIVACGGEQEGNREPSTQPGDTSMAERSTEGCANVIDVRVEQDGMTSDGIPTYEFDVTVQSNDLGWEKYADRWEVVDVAGRVLSERILTHPHETEQPFTRSQAGIPVEADRVVVRAHDSVEGFCGAVFELEVS